jgi:glycosyltransferase involved in cell wall biosynthesis
MSQNLSVVLSVYNAMPYLSEAVESILRQTYEDFSLIIINDGSTDGSLEHLRSLEDPRIVLIDQENMGLGFSLNVGLRLCKSKYVARMDADDVSLPGRFAAQIEFLEANPNIVMVGTQVEFLIRNRVQKALRVPTNHDDIRSRLFVGRAGLCHPSVMFRTGAAIACGGYPVGIIGEDIDFFLRMCEQGTVANLDQALLRYRLHVGQLSQTKCRELVSANRYAGYCARCRHRGLPPQSFHEFLRDSSLINRWRRDAEAWELLQYRTGRIQLASGKPIEGTLRLALLGICRPFRTIRRVIQTFGAA